MIDDDDRLYFLEHLMECNEFVASQLEAIGSHEVAAEVRRLNATINARHLELCRELKGK